MKRIKQRIRNLFALLSSVIFLNPATVRPPDSAWVIIRPPAMELLSYATLHSTIGFRSQNQQGSLPAILFTTCELDNVTSPSKNKELE